MPMGGCLCSARDPPPLLLSTASRRAGLSLPVVCGAPPGSIWSAAGSILGGGSYALTCRCYRRYKIALRCCCPRPAERLSSDGAELPNSWRPSQLGVAQGSGEQIRNRDAVFGRSCLCPRRAPSQLWSGDFFRVHGAFSRRRRSPPRPISVPNQLRPRTSSAPPPSPAARTTARALAFPACVAGLLRRQGMDAHSLVRAVLAEMVGRGGNGRDGQP
jgi:hypothetical protein